MGEPPPSGNELQRLLEEQRESALSSLNFFARVAPLAQRLGMNDFPAFEAFSSRFHDTEDINTGVLRLDGQILTQVHRTAVAQVDQQREQDAPLATCWPDGSGVVARQQLGTHVPRADADISMLGDVAAGLLVAADCIDVARLAKFTAIATVSPDTVLGMPIGHWLALEGTSVLANSVALRAAITAAVNLFGSAVNTCDQAIEALLTGVCGSLAGMNTSEYPTGDGTDCPAPEPACPAAETPCPTAETPATATTGISGGASTSVSTGSPAMPAASPSPAVAVPAAAIPHPGAASVMTAGVGTSTSAFGQMTPASTVVLGAQVATILGPVIGAVGQALTAAVTGVVEAVVSVQSAPSAPNPGGPGPSSGGDAAGPASIDLGDKTIEIKAGADGLSVSLTVHGAGSVPDSHILDVLPDGGVELRGTDCPEKSEPAQKPDDQPESGVATPTPAPAAAGGPPASSHQAEPAPDTEPDSPAVQDCPPPVAAVPQGKTSAPVPHPAGVSDERGAQVAPQSSAPEETPPHDDGVLALAGEQ